jgi:hypothetical protein
MGAAAAVITIAVGAGAKSGATVGSVLFHRFGCAALVPESDVSALVSPRFPAVSKGLGGGGGGGGIVSEAGT